MCQLTECLSLHRVDLTNRRVTWVDGFEGMDVLVQYLRDRADRDHSYIISDEMGTIWAMAFFTCDNLMLLTSEGEVVRDASEGRGIPPQGF